MYYCKLPYILFRDYTDFGYLSDNRNFGYDTASKSCIKTGDRILSKTGSIFYYVLKERLQSLEEIATHLSHIFDGASVNEIMKDAEEFYKDLSDDGFLFRADNIDKNYNVNIFSYDNTRPFLLTENMGHDVDEQFHAIFGEKYKLTRIHIDISGLCNERCVHCYIPDKFKNRTMRKEMFDALIEQIVECNVLNVTISGGEPMLNSNLSYFISKCRERNLSINVLSNLTLLSEELVREFENTPLLSVQTSLYSMDGKIHDSITNTPGSFEKTKRGIEILHKHNIPMQINCSIIKQNKDSYQGVLAWAHSLNIEASSDYSMIGSFDASCKNLQCRLDISDVEAIIKEKAHQPKASTVLVSQNNNKNIDSSTPICPVCTNSLCVSHLGDVYPCEGWQSNVLGNIKNITLEKIWEESTGVNKLRGLTYKDFPKCLSCEYNSHCSICLIRNANENPDKDYMNPNPYFCSIAKAKKQIAEETS